MNFLLTDLAADEIGRLEAEGVHPTAQEVLTIQQLSLEATGVDEDTGSLARGTPYEAGGEWLYPLTLAGNAFYVENEKHAANDRERLLLLGYAMRWGHDGERIYGRGREALCAVRKWGDTLRCTLDELAECMDKVVGDVPPVVVEDTEDAEEARRQRLSLLATALVGGNPEVWETQCSFDSVCKIIETAFAHRLAAGGAANVDPRIRGLKRLGLYVEGIRGRHGKREP